MVVTLDGILTLVKETQPANALLSMLVSPDGIVRSVQPLSQHPVALEVQVQEVPTTLFITRKNRPRPKIRLLYFIVHIIV